MSYRQHSFDPNAYEQPGPPLKPYNAVQWLGVVLGTIGVLLSLVWFAGKLGWITPVISEALPAIVLCLIGSVLVNSRRGPATQVGTEQLARNGRTLVITVAICAVIIGAALVIEGVF